MVIGVRQRQKLSWNVRGNYIVTISQVPIITQPTIKQYFSTDYVSSVGNWFPHPKRFGVRFDSGGPFESQSITCQAQCPSGHYTRDQGNIQYIWDGPIPPVDPQWMLQAFPAEALGSSFNQIQTAGVRGYNITVPNAPRSQALQFFAELRDLPKLPQWHNAERKARAFVEHARRAGNEYLNIEFGWKPFVKDIQDMTKSTIQAKKHVKQFLDNSGKNVRRRRQLSSVSTALPPPRGNVSSSGEYNIPNVVVAPGVLSYTDSLKETMWFSACYTYYVQPTGQGWIGNIKRGEQIANTLYGTRITPSLLYELAPWSWAIDYFSDVGGIMKNLSAFSGDNLVANYAYVMCETKLTRTAHLQGLKVGSGQTINSMFTVVYTRKRRQKGNPYGFGASFSPTAKQAAILAALGSSRLRG